MSGRVVHILTCGTSIVVNLERGVPGCALGAGQIGPMRGWAKAESQAFAGPVASWRTTTFTTRVGRYLPALAAAQDRRRLSAETASLGWQASPLPADDLVVLLASDTHDGMLAALLVAASLGRSIRVHPTPSDSTGGGEGLVEMNGAGGSGGPAEPVHVIRIPGLVPVRAEDFTAAIRDVARGVLWAAQRCVPPEDSILLHLSGGYKATLPYLVVLGEYLKAVHPVRAVCLHEGDRTNPTAVPQPIEIQLRRVGDEELNYTRAVLRQVEEGRTPDETRLRDFAYTTATGTARLTSMGEVLSVVVGPLAGM